MPRQVWFSTPAALAARFLRAELAFGRLALTVSLHHLKRRLLDEERQHDTPTAAQA